MINKDKKYENKIVIATRTDDKGFDECVKKLKKLSKINAVKNAVFKSYIICNRNGKINNEIYLIADSEKDPTRATSFNLVIDKLNNELKKNENEYHLLTFSKEVELHEENIKRMINEIEEKKIIVVGYRLMDNILSKKEYKQFANGNDKNNFGIAYQVPWNTCALWNKEFVYGSGKKKLIFDEICENNQLGHLYVKVNGVLVKTEFEGMEDGLAIAKIITNNPDKDLKYKLIENKKNKKDWIIRGNEERLIKHKIKMARKNIVLSIFMNIKGYSIDKLTKD